MGLAVLPSRLKSEIAYMKAAILDHVDFNSIENIKKNTAIGLKHSRTNMILPRKIRKA